LIKLGKWDDARNLAKDSYGALQSISALKGLLKSGKIEQKELERLKSLKREIIGMMSAGWLAEFDIDYFTLLFSYIDTAEKT
jgi:hypothetical protein